MMIVRSLLVAVLALALIVGNADDDAIVNTSAIKARLYRLAPDFVTNLEDPTVIMYAQIRVEVLVFKPEQVARIQYHEPLFRDEILTLLNTTSADVLRNPNLRDTLAEKIKVKMNNRLKIEEGQMMIDKVSLSNVVVEQKQD